MPYHGRGWEISAYFTLCILKRNSRQQSRRRRAERYLRGDGKGTALRRVRSMHRMTMCSAMILLISCTPNSKGDMGQNPLVKSIQKIRLSVVPILMKAPEKKDSYKIIATGFFIHEGGLIATASHVANTPELYTFFENKPFPCSVVKSQFIVTFNANDPKRKSQHVWDVAVLKIEGAEGPFPYARLSGKTEFGLGEPAAIHGYYDQGESYTVGSKTSIAALLTSGIVSAAFSISSGDIKFGSRLVLDITAGPGSSGSPAFDPESGEVIGIVSQGKHKLVLSPGAKPNQVEATRVPMGIADIEPIIHLREWLRQVAPTLGYK